MIFCGQCGLQLAPGDVRCPRCGAETEVGANVAVEELHTNDATIAASPVPFADPARPASFTPPQPQAKLVLRPGANYDYGQQAGNEATSRVQAPDYQATMNPSYPGYPTPGTSYPGFADQGYQVGANPYAQRQAVEVAQRAKGRTASLVVILLGLLLVLSAMVLFALQRNGVINLFGGNTANNATPTASAVVTTPVQQARTVVEQLYRSVNNKNYRAAYDLWKPDSQQPSFATFEAGYAHTRHTNLTITDAQLQSDGTVKVSVRLIATEDATGDTTRQSTYQGYYIVQQQTSGVWLIQRGTLQKV